jgi:uncharacterized protein (TIGR02996 family)
MERVLLEAMHTDPADLTARLGLADALEEGGRAEQAELTRLHLRQLQGKGTLEELNRLNALLAAGVLPVVPELTCPSGMRFALIPPGTFRTEGGVRITLTRPYYLGTFPVTQAGFKKFAGENPSHFTGRRRVCKGQDVKRFPVESVNWTDADGFATSLSRRSRGWEYRLPTEAEWERACRAGAGHTQPFHTGKSLVGLANFDEVYGKEGEAYLRRPSAVGSFPPNAFGLHDMLGNVWEWCADWFVERPFGRRKKAADPTGPVRGIERATRGGCWDGTGPACWTAYRIGHPPAHTDNRQGFRLALTWTPDLHRRASK